MGKNASTEGDVYSFGVLVLEMVSGRRPTDVLSHEGSSLCEWIKRQYTQQHQLHNLVEQALQRFSPCGLPNHRNKILKDVILELIELGLLCTQHNPSTRPTMLDVAQEMGRLKDYLTKSTLPPHSSQVVDLDRDSKQDYIKMPSLCRLHATALTYGAREYEYVS
ncbi:hypothetical protein Fmac_012992 [Flemingia macrophylla]|uniref:Protein kinase domain-containing protein n=1 Tax=Flemingia macrophylla TaxID=520843 RepID=A0ABD1MRV4_9FABA